MYKFALDFSRNYTKHFRLHLYFLKDIYRFSHSDKTLAYAVPDDFEIAINCFAVLSDHASRYFHVPGISFGVEEIDEELSVLIPIQYGQYKMIYPGFVVSYLANEEQEASPFIEKIQIMYTKLADLKLFGLSYFE